MRYSAVDLNGSSALFGGGEGGDGGGGGGGGSAATTSGTSRMVSHKRLQQYNRYYGKTCMTGLYGCRWHRYQQSRDSTGLWDLSWFCMLVVVLLFILLWLYYWVAAFNNADLVNELIEKKVGREYDWHLVLLALTATTFGYVVLLFFLALLHAGYGHEVYMHKGHKVALLLVLVASIVAVELITNLWQDGWMLMYLSILASWPFIHLVVVTVMTLLTFLIAKRWMYLDTIGARVVVLVLFLVVMGFIYVSPLLIQPPCVQERDSLPPRPGLMAHRGGAAIAPENTLVAFQWSNSYPHVTSFDCDIQISWDGIPFLLRDEYLRRTTNVEEMFPERSMEPAYTFNISDLRKLNAGSWFLDRDPYGVGESFSPEQIHNISQQAIPTLEEVLVFVNATNKSILLNLVETPPEHPYASDYLQLIIKTVMGSGINPHKVLWQYSTEYMNTSTSFRTVTGMPLSVQQLHENSIGFVNLPYRSTDLNLFSMYAERNITVNLHTVNSWWLYSLCWCAGISSVTTNRVRTLATVEEPMWMMSPLVYLVVWVVADVVSACAIISIFIYNRVKKTGAIFNPETLSLQAMQHRISQTRQNRNMKEKLLHTAESIQDMENGIVGIVTPPSSTAPATPATPATLETPTTPLSPTSPNVTVHRGNGNVPPPANNNITYSSASGGFFADAKEAKATEARGEPHQNGYIQQQPQQQQQQQQPVAVPNGNVALTDTQVRGFFDNHHPLKTDHYRSMSDHFVNGFRTGAALSSVLARGLNNEKRPHSDFFSFSSQNSRQQQQQQQQQAENEAAATTTTRHVRSNSESIPNRFLADTTAQSNGERVDGDLLYNESALANLSRDHINNLQNGQAIITTTTTAAATTTDTATRLSRYSAPPPDRQSSLTSTSSSPSSTQENPRSVPQEYTGTTTETTPSKLHEPGEGGGGGLNSGDIKLELV